MTRINKCIDPAVCMVVGCGRKALYRHAGSNRSSNSQRGYCSAHRHLAVETARARQLVVEYFSDRIASRDDRGPE